MNKGFVYESTNPSFPTVAVVFDVEGTVVRAQAVESVEEGEEFIRQLLTHLRQITEGINRG